MKIKIERQIGIIPVTQSVELEVDELPPLLNELLTAKKQPGTSRGITRGEGADTSKVRLRLDNDGGKTIEIDESVCAPKYLDAIDDLWEQAQQQAGKGGSPKDDGSR